MSDQWGDRPAVKAKPRVERNRVLVTGGAGFVGSHLCDYLVKRGDHVSAPAAPACAQIAPRTASAAALLLGARRRPYAIRPAAAARPHRRRRPCPALPPAPAQVICLDNFFTGSKDNVAHLLHKQNFEIIRHDVVEPILLEIDQVYHLACPASPVHYKYNPIKTIKTGFMGTMNMLGLAKRCRARFLISSTSEVYGDPLEHPQTESYWGNVNPIGERSCYDEGKRAAECLTFDYAREHGLAVRVVRIFNTYGPRMALDDGRVVSNFVAQALRGEALTIFGDGQQTRSFQFVEDLIRGMVAVMDNDDHLGPFNVGNPGEFTMLELAEIVREVVNPAVEVRRVAWWLAGGRVSKSTGLGGWGRRRMGAWARAPREFLPRRAGFSRPAPPVPVISRSFFPPLGRPRPPFAPQIVYKENTADDPSRRRPDITKIKTLLGWEPQVALREGLLPMVADFRRRLKLSEEIKEEIKLASARNSTEKGSRPAGTPRANGGA